MPCYVPDEHRHLRWHVIVPNPFVGYPGHWEIAEWVNDEGNAPDPGHWVRWGYCGDFPSLCQAVYVGPFPDQEMLNKAPEVK